jgi:type I restriction enzyme, R subunit
MNNKTPSPTTHITQQQLESYLWGAATLLRGVIDAGDYKQYIFPLLFFKRVYDEEFQRALDESDVKQLLEIARDIVEAEKEVDPIEEQNQGKAALTELFIEVRNGKTPIMVERIVNDIDEIVRIVRFPGWQQTIAGDREVKQALRKTLLKYKLHQEQELFDRAYAYIQQYY